MNENCFWNQKFYRRAA